MQAVQRGTTAMIYFRTYAKENGCPEKILNSGDFAVWNWIVVYQGKPPLTLPIKVRYGA